MSVRAFIAGCAGAHLSADERDFFAEADPWGLILFARNCQSPEQISGLTGQFRACVGRDDAPVLIDQEGGRVQRLRPPHWPDYPPARRFGDLFAIDRELGTEAAQLSARLIAHDLLSLGITVDCLPVLDVPVPGAHDIIGDRAYGTSAEVVAELGRVQAEALIAGGVLPVIKHIPGHGRAGADSHLSLPVVDADRSDLEVADFAPFRALNDAPMAMTAHVVYRAIDPDHPATLSPVVIGQVIREWIGFSGLLMSDDLSMGALSGSIAERTTACFAAGCDIALHCNGDMNEMQEVAAEAPLFAGDSALRAERAVSLAHQPAVIDVDEARARLARILDESDNLIG